MTQIADMVPSTALGERADAAGATMAAPVEAKDVREAKARRKEYPYDGKTLFGMAVNGLVGYASLALMSSIFMTYLTDYAGIGPWGATLATVVLFVGRIFDAVNDPVEGWIMDSAKVTRHGKYRKFIIASIIIVTVSSILLYNIPDGLVSNPVLVGIWVFFFYFAYDVGSTFAAFVPLVQSVTKDDELRARFFTVNRLVSTAGALPAGMIMTFALALGQQMGGIKTAIGILVTVMVVVFGAISLIGILMIREGNVSDEEVAEANNRHAERIRFHDIIAMVKLNRAMAVQIVSSLFSGFMWTTTSAVVMYYVKWAYNADMAAGVVNNSQLAFQSLLLQLVSLGPIFLMTGFSPLLVRKMGSNLAVQRLSLALMSLFSLMLFVCELAGVLRTNFWVLFIILMLINCASGFGFVPSIGLWAESIDYNRYMVGKEMGALVTALRSLLEKAQNALAGGIVGVLLIMIGYNVDSETGNYLGDVSQLPALLDRFTILMGVVPAILGAIAFIIYRWWPITPEIRASMQAKFAADEVVAKA
ncbi:MFS transporter [Bifidobacterium miconisargentati]|uniref:MFS transporter n=1 Tax=Bifidobacterium miconisargentati TaxID=2834437 RepID=UPI001BDD7361|nr:MFS transporter [Bifidobacterium miconisargentati]MBW3089831.1 MFS transporter [Bifidobacterium miconisargentati]